MLAQACPKKAGLGQALEALEALNAKPRRAAAPPPKKSGPAAVIKLAELAMEGSGLELPQVLALECSVQTLMHRAGVWEVL